MAAQYPIEGKKFLITGSASGLGAAYAEAFMEQGAKNIAVLDINEKVGKEFVDKLNKKHGNKAIFVKCDVASETDIQKAFEEVLGKFTRIDVLINNAGIMNDSKALWRTACDVNWQGLVSFSEKGMEHMRKDKGGAGGTIINISSTAGLARLPILPIYCGAKGAVLHFSQTLGDPNFYKLTDVRILTFCIGPTDTPLMVGLSGRSFDSQYCEIAMRGIKSNYQKVESAVTTMMKMFKEGANRSVWLSNLDKPPQDITNVIENNYKELEKLDIFG